MVEGEEAEEEREEEERKREEAGEVNEELAVDDIPELEELARLPVLVLVNRKEDLLPLPPSSLAMPASLALERSHLRMLGYSVVELEPEWVELSAEQQLQQLKNKLGAYLEFD